jgi:hypothetical protein
MMSSFSNNLGTSSVMGIAPTGAVMRIGITAIIRMVLPCALYSFLYVQLPDFIQGYWPKSCLEKRSKDAVICQFWHFMFMYPLTVALSLCMNGAQGQMIAGEWIKKNPSRVVWLKTVNAEWYRNWLNFRDWWVNGNRIQYVATLNSGWWILVLVLKL